MLKSKIIGNKFLQDMTSTEIYAWLSGSFGVLLILLLSTVVASDETIVSYGSGYDKRLVLGYVKYLVFFCITVAVPLFSYFIIHPQRHQSWLFSTDISRILLSINLMFILIGSIWFGAPILKLHLPTFNAKISSIAYLIVMALTFFLIYLRRNSSLQLDSSRLEFSNNCLLLLTPVTLIVATMFPSESWGVNFNNTAAIWGTIVALLIIIVWHRRVRANNTLSEKFLIWLVTTIVFVVPVLMMDYSFTYEILHYTAYLGPAISVEAGRIPLQDVFCQYGLSYLVYNLGFRFLPQTYTSAALITFLVNYLYMLSSLLILRKLVKNHLCFLIVGITLPFFFWLTYNYNFNMTPSHGGMRYLPIFILATVLVWMNPIKRFTILSVAGIFLAWAWSFEAAIYSTVIYAVFLIAHASVDGAKNIHEVFINAVGSLSKLLVLLIAFIIIVCTCYLVATGHLPRYDLYLSLVMSYVGTDPFMDYLSNFRAGFFTWVTVLTSYMVAACLVARQCFRPSPCAQSWIPKLGVMAALGITVSVYCLLGTDLHTFRPILLPFYLLFYWAIDVAMVRSSLPMTNSLTRASILGLAPILILLWYILMGVSVGNFEVTPTYGKPNSILLRKAFYFNLQSQVSFKDMWKLLHSPSSPYVLAHDQSANKVSQNDLVLVNRWQRQESSLLLFFPLDTYVNVYFRKPHTLFLSMSYVDGFSPQLFENIIMRSRDIINDETKEFQTAIVHKDLSLLNNLEWTLLKELTAKWALERIDESENLVVYRLIKNSKITSGNLLILPNRPIMTRNVL